MRRGTPSAYIFGELVFAIRQSNKMSMRQTGLILGAPAATVQQVEKGRRAVKEPKLHAWSQALKVDEELLTLLWHKCQDYTSDRDALMDSIIYIMDKMAPDATFSINVNDIVELKAIVRRRGGPTISTPGLREKIAMLNAHEKNRVLGYIDGLLEQREEEQ